MKNTEEIIQELRKNCTSPTCATQIGITNLDIHDAQLCDTCYKGVVALNQNDLLEMYTSFTEAINEQDYKELVFSVLTPDVAMNLLKFILENVLTEEQHIDLDLRVKTYIKEDYFELANELMKKRED